MKISREALRQVSAVELSLGFAFGRLGMGGSFVVGAVLLGLAIARMAGRDIGLPPTIQPIILIVGAMVCLKIGIVILGILRDLKASIQAAIEQMEQEHLEFEKRLRS